MANSGVGGKCNVRKVHSTKKKKLRKMCSRKLKRRG
jgi:hypothetical protein